jgi:hypothetical protein
MSESPGVNNLVVRTSIFFIVFAHLQKRIRMCSISPDVYMTCRYLNRKMSLPESFPRTAGRGSELGRLQTVTESPDSDRDRDRGLGMEVRVHSRSHRDPEIRVSAYRAYAR